MFHSKNFSKNGKLVIDRCFDLLFFSFVGSPDDSIDRFEVRTTCDEIFLVKRCFSNLHDDNARIYVVYALMKIQLFNFQHWN